MEKDFRNELMDYLYNEMSPEEKELFEERVANDPDLQNEIAELRSIRGALGELQDKEVVEPVTSTGPKGKQGEFRSVFSKYMKPLLAAAASISLVLLVGYLTHFTIRFNDAGFYLGFTEKQAEPGFGEEAVRALIRTEIKKNNSIVLNRMDDSFEEQSAKFDARFTSMNTELQSIGNTTSNGRQMASDENLKRYIETAQKNNIALLKQYLKLSNEQQQSYYQDLLTQFSDYIQEQREEDLLLIKRSLLNLKENQDLQKQETDQRLASLFTNVNSRND